MNLFYINQHAQKEAVVYEKRWIPVVLELKDSEKPVPKSIEVLVELLSTDNID
jgi:hypothetical protein